MGTSRDSKIKKKLVKNFIKKFKAKHRVERYPTFRTFTDK